MQINLLYQTIFAQTKYQKGKKSKVYSPFKDNICRDNICDMQLISTYKKRIRFQLFFIDIYSK